MRNGIDGHGRRQHCSDHHLAVDQNRLDRLLHHVGEDRRRRSDRLNLMWMLAVTTFLSMEKLLGVRLWLMRASGIALLGAGAVMIVVGWQ